jgi:hypothetical protein
MNRQRRKTFPKRPVSRTLRANPTPLGDCLDELVTITIRFNRSKLRARYLTARSSQRAAS